MDEDPPAPLEYPAPPACDLTLVGDDSRPRFGTHTPPPPYRAFRLIRGDGPAPAAQLFRHPDGFACLNFNAPERSRAQLRLVDESFEAVVIVADPGGEPRF